VMGIESEAPGFEMVKIEPRLGHLRNISCEIPHPRGKIFASYQMENGKWKIQIGLPGQTTGRLIWNKKEYLLKGGNNDFTFNQREFSGYIHIQLKTRFLKVQLPFYFADNFFAGFTGAVKLL